MQGPSARKQRPAYPVSQPTAVRMYGSVIASRNAALNEIALGRRAKIPPHLGRGFIL